MGIRKQKLVNCEANVRTAMEDLTPLEFLKAIYSNEALPLHARLKGAAPAINSRPAMKVIPPPKVDASPEPPPDHSGPFAQNTKHRFRRF
jgi:hypothetical protein